MFSVIVPVYNVEKYINQCIDSIINQTYKDIEIILVNDGSTDGSLEICNQYKATDPRISVISKKNEGIGEARNTGLKVATRKYVTFVDSDDMLDKDAIYRLYNCIIETGADTVLGGYARINENGTVIFKSYQKPESYTGNKVKESFFPRLLGSSPTKRDAVRPSVWNVAYSLDIIKENNLCFPSERRLIAEDMVFDICYYQYVRRVEMIDFPGYLYRVNPSSITNTYKADRFDKICILYDYVIPLIRELNYGEDVIQRCQRQFFVYTLTCLNQEVGNKSFSFKTKNGNIFKIVNNKFLQEQIATYPINKVQLQPRIFLLLLKWKSLKILMLLLKLKKQNNAA